MIVTSKIVASADHEHNNKKAGDRMAGLLRYWGRINSSQQF